MDDVWLASASGRHPLGQPEPHVVAEVRCSRRSPPRLATPVGEDTVGLDAVSRHSMSSYATCGSWNN